MSSLGLTWANLLAIAIVAIACLAAGVGYVTLRLRKAGWHSLATPQSCFETVNATVRRFFRMKDALLVCAFIGVCAVYLLFSHATVHGGTWFNSSRGHDLSGVSDGSLVQIQGVVIYHDTALNLFWVQDQTGGIAVAEEDWTRKVPVGESVVLEGHLKNSADGPVRRFLNNVRGKVVGNGTIPDAVPITLRRLSDGANSAARVQVSGIVRAMVRDPNGRTGLVISDSGPEVVVVVPGLSNAAQMIDTRVRASGVVVSDAETVQGRAGFLVLSDKRELVLEEAAPTATAINSVRSLYQQERKLPPHRVLVRGVISSRLSPTSIVLEDSWGRIRCDLASATNLSPGTQVEVAGFPTFDSPLIDLSHAVVRESAAANSSAAVMSRSSKDPVLTSIEAVRSLSESQANSALPAAIIGVVTYNDDRWRQLFIQDGDQGIYIKYPETNSRLRPGDRVKVVGLTNAGGFAPVIVAPRILKLGRSRLPVAVAANAQVAASGALDARYVSLEGVVHPIKAKEEPSHVTFELYSSFGQIHVYTPASTDAHKLSQLEDATVRLSGVFGTVFNNRRQLVGYQLSLPSTTAITVLQPAPPRPFDNPPKKIRNVLQFSAQNSAGHRLKLEGVVTHTAKGFFYLQDESGGIAVQPRTGSVQVSEVVDVIGYAAPQGEYSPVITDAMIRSLHRTSNIVPKVATAQSILQGEYDSELITVEGRVLSMLDTPDGESLVMQSGTVTFTARLEGKLHLDPGRARVGSILKVTGICTLQVDQQKLYLLFGQEPVTFSVLMRSQDDVQIIRSAPWWDLERILPLLAVLALLVVLALVWVTILSRRIRSQSQELTKAAETAQAIRDLSSAMTDVSSTQDFTARVSVRGSEQIAQLVVGFNNMLQELEERDQAKCVAESKLHQQAVTDELTGLPNRRLFTDRLAHAVEVAKRENKLLAVLYIDLDGFKLVNDSLGHTAGDKLLSQVAERLRSRVRRSDTLARLGGDEFTMILAGCHHREDAELVASMLLDALSAPFWVEGHEIRVGGSIGVSFFPWDGTTAAGLLQQADSAMYAAKRNGKNRVMFFTQELGTAVRERLTLESQLRNALASHQISVQYQPEFDLSSGRLVRFEALARWTDPVLGTVSPARFIPVAEETGLIVPLGAYVMERACEEARNWQSVVNEPVQVAVNVSTLEFTRDTFVQDVATVLQQTGLHPELLQIELTESAMVTGVDRAAQTIQQLRALGVSVAIDDFGTGYSCLSYLPRLSFDALKIDRSFIRELPSRPEIAAMVHSLVTLAHNLRMRVIVEGVETELQLQGVSDLGADEVQGFLLGRPTSDPLSQLECWKEGLLTVRSVNKPQVKATSISDIQLPV